MRIVLVISWQELLQRPHPNQAWPFPQYLPKKSLKPSLLEITFFQCRNVDISSQKCGSKLSLLPFSTVDSLIHIPRVVPPCILYDAVTPTVWPKPEWKKWLSVLLSSLPIYFCSGSQQGLEPNPASVGQKIGQKAGKHPGQQCLNWANTHQYRVVVLAHLCTVIFHCLTVDQTRTKTYWNFCHQKTCRHFYLTSYAKNIL